jgi:hypothetical protein
MLKKIKRIKETLNFMPPTIRTVRTTVLDPVEERLIAPAQLIFYTEEEMAVRQQTTQQTPYDQHFWQRAPDNQNLLQDAIYEAHNRYAQSIIYGQDLAQGLHTVYFHVEGTMQKKPTRKKIKRNLPAWW